MVEYESIKAKEGEVEEIDCGETKEAKCLGPEEGQCFMIHKVLTASSFTPQDNQREAIFHSKCTIGDKACSLIIDGGSCVNVASQVLIDELQLPTNPHFHPYVVQWLNKSKGLQESRRVFLSFSIGKSLIKWSFGATSSPWMRAMSCWAGLGCSIGESFMMAMLTLIHSKKMDTKSPSFPTPSRDQRSLTHHS